MVYLGLSYGRPVFIYYLITVINILYLLEIAVFHFNIAPLLDVHFMHHLIPVDVFLIQELVYLDLLLDSHVIINTGGIILIKR